MKFCQSHWDQLRAAIDERGLSVLVARDGAQAIERVKSQLDSGVADRAGFDPLMNANFAIWSNAIERGGKYLMFGSPDGTPYCPICESEAHNGPPAAWWINNAADEQLEKARSLGLAPGVQ